MECGGVSQNEVRRSVMEWSTAECHGMEYSGVSQNEVRRSVTELIQCLINNTALLNYGYASLDDRDTF